MSKKVSILLVVMLLGVALLSACKTEEVITDTELNVLCTPQEQWCQGMKQEFEALYGSLVRYHRQLCPYVLW